MIRNQSGGVANLAALALVVLGAAGCSGGSGTPAPAASTAAAAKVNDINPMPREKLRDGGRLTWPLDQIPSNFNYYELDGTLQDTEYVTSALIPSAFTSNAAGVPVWNPDLLAAEPVIRTEPQQVVTYEINPRAVWYEGTPITWQDFYWQWMSSNGRNKAYKISAATGYENIGKIERGRDDREVVVTYKVPFADWQSLFGPLYPASTNKDPKVFNEGWVNAPLTTAGPFKLGSIDHTAKTITLVRNEKWWGDPPKLDSIVYRFIDHSAWVDALANGEIDAMDIGSDANQFQRASQIPGVRVRVAGGPNFRHLTFNGSSPVLADVRVRRALAMAIDRVAIARALLAPLQLPAEPLNNHIFMRNQEGYADNSGETGTYDPARAASLLDEAGWKLDSGLRRRNGQVLTVKGVIPSAVQTSRQEMELIQNMLAQMGVKLDIQTVPTSDFFDKYVIPGQFDLTLFSWMGTPYPISSQKSLYAQPTKGPDGQQDVQQNYARIGSPELDQQFDRASREFDRARAEQIMNQADAMIWNEVHSLTLYQRPELIACKTGLANFGAFGFAQPWRYQDIGWMAAPDSH
ncbi:MAG TPA: ABC transporter family substrate-binding protein [Steroidobacteraceae bacterium]|nr:ABC transporter family substrate-binding protein [Steroidobacteraceae bacterium]